MTLISTSALRKITFVVLTIALLTFGATEIHKLLIVPRQQQTVVPTPLPAPTKDWNAPPEGRKEPLPGSYYFPSDEEMVEGVVIDFTQEGTFSKTGKITLDTGDQSLAFYAREDTFFAAPEDGEEITSLVGRKMRIYYEKKDGKLYLVFGEHLSDENSI